MPDVARRLTQRRQRERREGRPGEMPQVTMTTLDGDEERVRLIPPSDDGEIIKDNDIALVRLSGLNVTRLFSGEWRDGKDNLKRREGTIAFSLNGQETSLSWATNGNGQLKNPKKFQNHVLFLGKPGNNIDMEVQIIETDEDTVKSLTRGKSLLTVASRFGALIPGAGMLVSAATNLVGAIVDLIRSNVDDDLELSFHGSLGNLEPTGESLRSGEYRLVRSQRNAGQDEIGVTFELHRFSEAPRQEGDRPEKQTLVAVVLKKLELELTPELDDYHLQFDASMGSGKHGQKTSVKAPIKNGPARIDDVVGLRNKVLYKGPWTVGVPFYVSLAGVKNKDELEAIEGLIDGAGKLATAVAEGRDQTIAGATKAAQSVRAAVIEFLPKKISVGSMSGIIAHTGALKDDRLKELRNFVLVDPNGTWHDQRLVLVSEQRRYNKATLTLAIRTMA